MSQETRARERASGVLSPIDELIRSTFAPPPVRPVRVGFLIDELKPGAGTENQLILLLRSLDRDWVEPYLCCLRETEGLADLGLQMPIYIAEIKKLISLQGFRRTRALADWMRSHRLDLVLPFFRDANIVGTIAGRMARTPVISARRNLGAGYWHTARELAILRLLNRYTHHFISNSRAVRRYTIDAERVDGDRVSVIPNAIDTAPWSPDQSVRIAKRAELNIDDDEVLVGCVANLRPVKNHELLLRGFAIAKRQHSRLRLMLVGGGDQRIDLERLARELEIDDAVTFLGQRDDVSALMQAFDISVLPSKAESSSNALIESMVAARAIVASEVGGSTELLADGRGLLFDPDDADTLAVHMVELARNSDLRAELGQSAREYALAEHALPVIIDRWHQFFVETSQVPRLRSHPRKRST